MLLQLDNIQMNKRTQMYLNMLKVADVQIDCKIKGLFAKNLKGSLCDKNS